MQSLYNETNVPLRAGSIFLGKWENVLDYDSAFYSIIADQDCQVEFYQSNDKKTITMTPYNYTALSTNVINDVLLQQRYIYVTIRNSSLTNQTVLNFTMIYKNALTVEGAVSVTNFPSGFNVNNTPDVIPTAPADDVVVWNAAAVGSGVGSTSVNPAGSNIFVFGNVSGTTTLTVQAYGNSAWFNTQYAVTLNGASNFGFSINCSCGTIRLYNTTACTITAVISSKSV